MQGFFGGKLVPPAGICYTVPKSNLQAETGAFPMNDVFLERMVKKKLEPVDILLMILIVAGALLLSWLGFIVGFFLLGFPMLTVVVLTASVYGAYKLIGTRLVEYEYCLTNGNLTVDRILQKSRRKRLTSFECSSCADIGRYGEAEPRLKNQSFDLRLFATSTSDRSNAWYMNVRSSKTGKTLVVFEPDEALLEAIKQFLPRQLRFEKGLR